MFSKNKKAKYMGQIIFGFGCLFYGLELMGDNLANISKVTDVITVPILAPIIIPIDCSSVINPERINPIARAVVPELFTNNLQFLNISILLVCIGV